MQQRSLFYLNRKDCSCGKSFKRTCFFFLLFFFLFSLRLFRSASRYRPAVVVAEKQRSEIKNHDDHQAGQRMKIPPTTLRVVRSFLAPSSPMDRN